MQLKASLFITSLSTLVMAMPQGGPIAGSIQLWTGPNFTGRTTTLITRVGDCVPFPAGFREDVSSVEPLTTWQCKLFTNRYCDSASFTVVGPTTLPANNKFNAVSCTPITQS